MTAPQSASHANAQNYALAPTPVDARDAWVKTACVLALPIGVFFLFWPTAMSLLVEWGDTRNLTYTHGYLIAGICVWLIARKREALAQAAIAPDRRAAIALFVATVIWLIAFRAGIQIIDQLLIPVLMWLTVCTAFGYAVARPIAFAILYLTFAIPVWDYINFILQGTTVAAVDLLLKTTGVTAFVEGNMVHIPAGVFEIAGGCSGLHFFIVGFAIAALYGEIGGDSLKVRLQILAVGIGLSLLSNWLRVYVIIIAGDLTNMQHYLVRVEHYRFGWFMFALVMIAFFAIVRRFPVAPLVTSQRTVDTASLPGARWKGIALACAAIAFVPIYSLLTQGAAAALPTTLLPTRIAGWTGPQSAKSAWNPVFNGVDQSQRGAYVSDRDEVVEMYVAAYRSQTQEKELVSYGNSFLGPDEGYIAASSRIDSAGPVTEAIVEHGRERSIIWYFYDIGGARTNRDIEAQLTYGVRSLVSAPLSMVVAMRAACVPDCAAARSVIGRFETARAQATR